jgi:hypothetical protein
VLVKESGLDGLLEHAAGLDSANSFVRLIFRALRIFGKAKISPNGEDRVVGYIVALESFLSDGNGPISQRVAEGTVIFLRRSIEERVRLRRELLRFYGLRSKIAHGEEVDTIQPSDVWLLEDIVKEFILAMIAHRSQFETKHALRDFLERRRLS